MAQEIQPTLPNPPNPLCNNYACVRVPKYLAPTPDPNPGLGIGALLKQQRRYLLQVRQGLAYRICC